MKWTQSNEIFGSFMISTITPPWKYLCSIQYCSHCLFAYHKLRRKEINIETLSNVIYERMNSQNYFDSENRRSYKLIARLSIIKIEMIVDDYLVIIIYCKIAKAFKRYYNLYCCNLNIRFRYSKICHWISVNLKLFVQ